MATEMAINLPHAPITSPPKTVRQKSRNLDEVSAFSDFSTGNRRKCCDFTLIAVECFFFTLFAVFLIMKTSGSESPAQNQRKGSEFYAFSSV